MVPTITAAAAAAAAFRHALKHRNKLVRAIVTADPHKHDDAVRRSS